MHHERPHDADVTEGSGGISECLPYDWSDPDHAKLTTTDSNVFGGALGYTYTLKRQPDGTTDVDVVIVRDGKNLGGGCSRLCWEQSAIGRWETLRQ